MTVDHERTGSTRSMKALALAATLAASFAGLSGCRKDMAAVQQAPIVDGNAASDPANANMADPNAANGVQTAYAPVSGGPRYAANQTRVAGSSYTGAQQSSAESYPTPPANGTRNEAYNYNTQPPQGYGQNGNGQAGGYPADGNDDQLYSDLLDADVPLTQQPPPPLPQYEQPVAPGPDYLWTPGYWNYANTGYYYVPGNWISAPFEGALWTPGWWGYTGRGYGWHHGYWGRHVGYYGGVNYGFGFIGIGYQGGYWNNDHFYYNRAVNHVEPTRVNNYVYQRNLTVVNNTYINNSHTSYYGGPGGLQRRPVPAEFAAQREVHIRPLPAQVAERQQASQNRQQFYSSNNGRPQQMFAAYPVLERNVAVPPQLAHPQAFNRGGAIGGQSLGSNFNNGQLREAAEQQANLQRRQQDQQHLQFNQQQHPQQDQARNQQQFHQEAEQRRLQENQQQQALHQQQNQQRLQQDQQRNQQQQQVRQQAEQQRLQSNQQQVLRQQQDQIRNQQQQQVRQQAEQQRLQSNQQQQVLRQQQDQQRNQQQQQVRQQQDGQRIQQHAIRQQQDGQRAVQQQSVQQVRPQPQAQPRAEAPRPVSQPHVEAPRAAPAPHPEGGHEHGR